ncbi:enoyl-CoA hydratase/isomerase family protein [Rhizobiales bacterium L72]|uniref:3-hydroxyisobutyryl-CoA hydrolase n=2 Tax=Propylenella binzhouense TaxID=2555902 RepID=A0A964T2F1_9HYPH|nr:enoyl-CoA hydratase/isomerase family protein [Propylenella binzhouense]
MTTPGIRFDRVGRLGLVTLDRPEALNALTRTMFDAFSQTLGAWERDERVLHVAVRSSSPKAFCSGGDIRMLYNEGLAAKRGEGPLPLSLFEAEYRLNHRIRTYPKPYLALVDGIAMGGGAGISINGRYRVAGPNIRFAMPEVAIGLVPDIGSSHFLPRLPGEIGTYLALTGTRIGRADCLYCGLSTHAADPARFDAILDALAGGEAAEAVLARHADTSEGEAEPAPLAAERDRIDTAFAHDDLASILSHLEFAGFEGWSLAGEAVQAMSRASPTSLLITLRQMREGRMLSHADCLRMEYRIVARLLGEHDFYEGVRAQIVDKDRNPAWRPASLAQVDPGTIDRYFAPLDRELTLS